jgi:hypothetical protein
MTHSLTISLGTQTVSRTLRWDGGQYAPAPLLADTSSPRIFKGWANPSKEGVTLAAGDTWQRTGPDTAAVPIILDTDLDSDVDDVFDIKAALVYHLEGMADLLGIAVTTSHDKGPGVARAVTEFYGDATIPVSSYAPIGAFKPTSTALLYADLYDDFPHTGIGLGATVTDTVTAYRTWLAASSGGVRIIMTGFAKGIRAALQSTGDGISALNGNDLFDAKVERIYAVAGLYPSDGGSAEFNFAQNATDWNWLQANSPVPITWVGIELGNAVNTIGGTYMTDRLGADDITRAALTGWDAQHGGSLTRIPWGVVGVHAAVEGNDRYRLTPVAGANAINTSTGRNTFTPGAGTEQYLAIAGVSTHLRTHHNSIVFADGVSGTLTWNGTTWA